MEDDVFSDYPCLILRNKLVFKSNIGTFLKKTTDINEKFKISDQSEETAYLEKINRLETLCQTQLHLVTVSLAFFALIDLFSETQLSYK